MPQLQVFSRPNPQIEVGAVDCSVALVLCDLQQPDMPIVYVSDTFCELTGYSRAEALGKNCRFLQSPGGGGPNGFQQTTANHGVIRSIRQAVRGQKEIQTEIINYKKNGQRFKNFLSIIPVQPCSAGYRYAVGMMVEAE
jgi:PAS domain S-box-containing protein